MLQVSPGRLAASASPTFMARHALLAPRVGTEVVWMVWEGAGPATAPPDGFRPPGSAMPAITSTGAPRVPLALTVGKDLAARALRAQVSALVRLAG